YSTTVRYHNYRLREPVDDERGAGHEFDLEFMIEAPKGVKVTVGGGWYVPGMAVIGFVDRNLWSAYSNVSVSFGQ
ncbi:MAG TPA: hypothetical protein VEU30_01825, partial [Thermoanaerobaculia bacterium]|nr:hypothetical protein [Thermoanaerobaculia bacterium]